MLRFAPSPTSDMHIASLRLAIVNYIIAKQNNVNFIVRIEDMDQQKNITGKDTEFLEILEKFALPYDSVSHQSENLHIHQTLAIKLLEEKKAFICTCINEEEICTSDCSTIGSHQMTKLKEEKIPFVLRITSKISDVGSFVILGEDGLPTYNLACACDDMLSGVTLVIRYDDHLKDMPKQEHIKTLLGYEKITEYVHLPIILNNDGIKMNKKDDAGTLMWLFEQGFLPDAIGNYLLLLGNNTPIEIFTMPEALEWFKLESLSTSPVQFDIDKLRFINNKHLEMMDNKALSTLFGFADVDIGKLAKVYLEEASTISELESKIKAIFAPKDFSNKWGKEMRVMEKIIADAPIIYSYNEFELYMIKESKLKDENFFKPLRYLLTGAKSGPQLSDIYPLIKSYLLEVAS